MSTTPRVTRPGRQDPDDAGGSLDRDLAVVQTLLDAGRPEAALVKATALADAYPGEATAHNKRGVCLAHLGRLDEAAAAFAQATSLDPAFAPAWSNLGNVKYEQGAYQEAEAAYLRALQADPQYALAHRNLAAALRRLGRVDEAVRHMKEASRLAAHEGERPASGASQWLLYVVLGGAALLYWLWRSGLKALLAAFLAAGVVVATCRAAEAPQDERVDALWTFPDGFVVAGIDASHMTEDALRQRLAAMARSVLDPPVALRWQGRTLARVHPADVGIVPDLDATLRWAREAAAGPRRGGAGLLLAGPDPAKVEELAARLDEAVGLPVAEPRVSVQTDGTARIIPGRAGYRVDRAALGEALTRVAPSLRLRLVELEVLPVAPSIEEDWLESLRTPSLLAAYTTGFDPSNAQRARNIELAAGALDGLVLAPGTVFSFNEAVGPRIVERGYRTAPVVIGGRIAEDVGGGVCQVSSTLYNAALLAGLTAASRSAHSVPVWYVAPARDATVAWGLIDLKLANPTGHFLAISARVNGTKVTIGVWGPAGSPQLPWGLQSMVEVPAAPASEGGSSGLSATLWRELRLYGPAALREQINRSVYLPPQSASPVAPEPSPARP